VKSLHEEEIKAFLSGNVFHIPMMFLSLLRKEAIQQYARLDNELTERAIKQPVVGQRTPNVMLSSVDLARTVYLEELLKRKPITVINLGSYT